MTDNLAALAAQYEIALDSSGEKALTEYLSMLLEANEQFNLTAIKDPAEAVVDLARQSGIALLATPLTMYEAGGRLYAAGLHR